MMAFLMDTGRQHCYSQSPARQNILLTITVSLLCFGVGNGPGVYRQANVCYRGQYTLGYLCTVTINSAYY